MLEHGQHVLRLPQGPQLVVVDQCCIVETLFFESGRIQSASLRGKIFGHVHG